MSGQFITFEGTDGAGKTTVLNKVIEQIKPLVGDQLLVTREPGGDKISEQIRNIILTKDDNNMDKRTEALLFAAARRQHLVNEIIPALEAGKLVICDRYIDSSIAYQGAGREIGEKNIWQMNQFATEGLMPDTTIYFDISVDDAQRRIAEHRDPDDVNRMDKEHRDFYDRIHDAYAKISKDNPKRVVSVDATQSIDQVTNQVISILKERAKSYLK